jgi:hypothetical protein
MRFVILAAAMLILSGCAAPQRLYAWHGVIGNGEEHFGSAEAFLGEITAADGQCQTSDDCMAAKGFVRMYSVPPENNGGPSLKDFALIMLLGIGGAAQESNDRVNQGIADRKQYLRDNPPPRAPVTCTSSGIGDQVITRCR